MIVECVRNEGFEDQLTENSEYRVAELGDNSLLIENDQQEQRWYGRTHFRLLLEA